MLLRGTGPGRLRALEVSRSARSASWRWRRLICPGTEEGVAGALTREGLERLRLEDCLLDDACAWALLESPALASVRELSLAGNPLTAWGYEAVARSPHLVGLRALDLRGCLLDDEGVAALTRDAAFGLAALQVDAELLDGAALERVLRWRACAGLRTLTLRCRQVGDDDGLVEALASAAGARSLRSLTLSMRGLTARGAEALMRSPHLVGLRRLHVVDGGGLDAASQGALRAAMRDGVVAVGGAPPQPAWRRRWSRGR